MCEFVKNLHPVCLWWLENATCCFALTFCWSKDVRIDQIRPDRYPFADVNTKVLDQQLWYLLAMFFFTIHPVNMCIGYFPVKAPFTLHPPQRALPVVCCWSCPCQLEKVRHFVLSWSVSRGETEKRGAFIFGVTYFEGVQQAANVWGNSRDFPYLDVPLEVRING